MVSVKRMIEFAGVATIVAAFLGVSACGGKPQADRASHDSVKVTVKQIEARLSGERKARFREAIDTIKSIARSEARFERWECMRENPSSCADVDWYMDELLEEMVGGKSANEIIAEAHELEDLESSDTKSD